ncbi:MAG: ornithine cyclodeaminase [Pseudomonadota bacterium]
MQMLNAEQILTGVPFPKMVEALGKMHQEPIGLVDEMLMEHHDDKNNSNHFYIRCGWQPEKAVGAKVITVFPRNNQKQTHPSIQAVYVLFEAVDGAPIACLDGTALTWIKTASDSALGSSLLSNPQCGSMTMIGAGQMAPFLIRAHCEIRPSIKQIGIWNRSMSKAEALAELLQPDLPEIRIEPVLSLESSVRESDLICSAVNVTEPVIRGEWLKPGVHLDLVGAYRPEMREADDLCLQRGRLFVDARETTIDHIGELIIPLAKGVIDRSDILADLSDLCTGNHPGRESADEITVFKNGGGGHLDLMCAQILYQYCESA